MRSDQKRRERRPGSGDHVQGRDVIYGTNPVREALKAGQRLVKKVVLGLRDEDLQGSEIYKLCSKKKIPCETQHPRDLDRLASGGVHQGVVAYVGAFPLHTLDDFFATPCDKRLVLVMDCIQDPQNFGTLCRSALSFGVREVIIPKDRSVSITAAVCKASAGAVEHLKIIQVVNLSRTLQTFKENGYWVYGAALDDSAVNLKQVKPSSKSVVVLGSEGKGLRRLVAVNCDQLIKIEMQTDFDSLNVAQAGTVILYYFSSVV